ncbi:hypothetical protein [Mucilaginibacter sp.]|uniref:hypothetical protein n=1 Tax=Mucilaginibacter sp. TaxID=1882438 RepID=UPI00283CBC7C|nr:hypothetical protein [Mucilaginibacter sp.]MDR3695931.1 hypothetical protein [Mucilaginibacter sp.]
MVTNLFIILQAASGPIFASFIGILLVLAVCIGIFLVFRSIMLWYWKIDVIVKNQEQQIALLHKQIELSEQQNKILLELKASNGK